MKWFVDNFLASDKILRVLDVGSYDVAGGTYKQFFPASKFEYTGLDMSPGPNVDLVPAKIYDWEEIPDDSYDAVISGQAFEHMEFFWLAAAEMARVLKPSGYICIVAPRGFERHRYPVDCYRFDTDGMLAIARWCNLDPIHASTDMQPHGTTAGWHIEGGEDAFLVARKPEIWPGILKHSSYKFVPAKAGLDEGFIPCPPFPKPQVIPLDEHQNMLEQHKRELELKNLEILRLNRLLQGYENSKSWRITRPLRELAKLLRMLGKIK